jgi:hypothetical protein
MKRKQLLKNCNAHGEINELTARGILRSVTEFVS